MTSVVVFDVTNPLIHVCQLINKVDLAYARSTFSTIHVCLTIVLINITLIDLSITFDLSLKD